MPVDPVMQLVFYLFHSLIFSLECSDDISKKRKFAWSFGQCEVWFYID